MSAMSDAVDRDEPAHRGTPPAPEGIDAERVTAWFAANVPGVRPPLEFSLITGGHSNLTFEVRDAAGRRWVLRRPPLGHVLETAHDMRREFRVISALGATRVPVPPAVGLCEDESVNGAPFYVMDFVEGLVVRDPGVAGQLTIEERKSVSDSLVEVLAAIHAVDVDEVGLGDLGRREGYIERQLNRWYKQWNQSKTRELEAIDEVYSLLSSSVPDQGPATIVHGDYRLDNCIVRDGRVVAVLDWEICTLGDPLADVGLLMVYWGDPSSGAPTVPGAPTSVEGFASRGELLERYSKVSGRSVDGIDYYVAFGYWKLACIVEGVYARYLAGAMGKRADGDFSPFKMYVEAMADAALKSARQVLG